MNTEGRRREKKKKKGKSKGKGGEKYGGQKVGMCARKEEEEW